MIFDHALKGRRLFLRPHWLVRISRSLRCFFFGRIG